MSKPCYAPLDAFQELTFAVPDHACDSHAHIFGPYERYPLAEERSYTPPENGVERFLWHLDTLGLARGVLVTASACGTDNSSVLDALRSHPQRLRGVAVCDGNTDRATLAAWREAGVAGLRFNLYQLNGQAVYKNGVGLQALQALAPVMRELGMHAQVWVHAPDLPDLAPELERLGVPLVVDHMGRMNAALGTDNPGFGKLCAMLADGTAWTKISGADRNTNRKGVYDDIDAYALGLLRANPEHVVWGSDWPHINYFQPGDVPDDGVLLNTLRRWVPDDALLRRVLVDNPATLYGFGN
ncbi:amidohydrolase family protein [Candidimonas nitroreducens]|uniref:Amidohydrolase n=1 Tax=Candidimonas nitroreducens TaxID=683354 RepID=A0A225MXW0_9BURK|nr:amidohydrolase family protein [Candidimonas nitroreducens]OWT66227.1 amidohydrolase [Candidimonas nitroreducens]